LLDVRETDTGHREVRPATVERDVEEERRAAAERAKEVVLLRQGDEDVLDRLLQTEVRHRLALRLDDLGVARRGHFEVEAATTLVTEQHATLRIDERRADEAVDGVELGEAVFDVHGVLLGWMGRKRRGRRRWPRIGRAWFSGVRGARRRRAELFEVVEEISLGSGRWRRDCPTCPERRRDAFGLVAVLVDEATALHQERGGVDGDGATRRLGADAHRELAAVPESDRVEGVLAFEARGVTGVNDFGFAKPDLPLLVAVPNAERARRARDDVELNDIGQGLNGDGPREPASGLLFRPCQRGVDHGKESLEVERLFEKRRRRGGR
jgi:hypothetical protein